MVSEWFAVGLRTVAPPSCGSNERKRLWRRILSGSEWMIGEEEREGSVL